MTKGKRAAGTVTTVDGLKADPANRRTHNARNIEMIATALRSVGASRSIVIDEHDEVLAGNGVVRAAAQAGISKVQIVDVDGDTIVAVRRTGLTPEQKRDLAIYDNRTAELAAWDIDQLRADVNAGIDLQPFFFDGELAHLLGAGVTPGRTDPDALPEERPTSIVTGDLFELGVHRLLCGDCTQPTDVARAMSSETAVLMNTDPPYGIDYAALKNGIPRSGFQNIQARGGDIVNDDLTDGPMLQVFLETMIRVALPHLSPNPAFYLWHPMLTQGTFFAAAAAAAAADILIHRQIIWVKPHMVLTRSGQYHWKHELCFYGWIRGKPCPWYGDKSQVSVWPIGESQRGREHPTQKPVALFIPPIANHSTRGQAVYEPFAGSGSQFIAAEQLSRRCLGLEIEPRYCDVAIRRWEAFTGQKAAKVGEAVRA